MKAGGFVHLGSFFVWYWSFEWYELISKDINNKMEYWGEVYELRVWRGEYGGD